MQHIKKLKWKILKKVKNDIENVGGKIAGVILNKVPISTKKYEESYYSSGEDSRKFLEDVKKEMEYNIRNKEEQGECAN